jgi:hypothetical protein
MSIRLYSAACGMLHSLMLPKMGKIIARNMSS